MNRSIQRVIVVVVFVVAASVIGYLAVSTGSQGGPYELDFAEKTEPSGLNYTGTDTTAGNGNSSVYTADIDNNGWTDLLVLGGSKPALYLNQKGTFERSSALPEVESEIKSGLFYDADNDGWKDLLLLPVGGEPIFLANENGTFARQDVGFDTSLEIPVGATAADFDGDGTLDVFVTQYGDWREGTPAGYRTSGFVEDDNGNENYLFRWNGSGYERTGISTIQGNRWSLATSAVDLNGDGLPDIHVANDFNNDIVYLAQDDGTFEQRVLSGATARNGMSSEVADINRDGSPDLFVTNIYLPYSEYNMSKERYEFVENYFDFVLGKRAAGNTLLVNQGNATFVNEADTYGIKKGGWGWAATITDFDNDGRLDVFHTTQRLVRLDPDDPHYTYPMLWQQTDDGFQQYDSSEMGFAETDGRGMAHLDYDRDGDQDLVVGVNNGRFRLYENTVEGGNSVQLSLVPGNQSQTVIGATVTVQAGGGPRVLQYTLQSDYQSQDTRVLHVGVGESAVVDEIRIEWPDGTISTLTDVNASTHLTVSPDGVTDRRPLDCDRDNETC